MGLHHGSKFADGVVEEFVYIITSLCRKWRGDDGDDVY